MKPTFDTIVEALIAKGLTEGVTLPFAKRGYHGPVYHYFNDAEGEHRVIVTVWPMALRADDEGIEVYLLSPLGGSIVNVLKQIENL